jgi:uncharacterized membrane protein YdbT with pleckstrin-like domain
VSIEENLIAGETIDTRSTKAWIAPVRDSGVAVLLLIGAFFVDWITPGATTGIAGTIANILDLIRLGLVVVAVGWIAYNIVVWRTAEFAVTNLRVVREEGVISRRSSATLLTAISDVQSRVGFLGRSLHYGDLLIFTQSGGAGADRFRSITEPDKFRNAIMTRKLAETPQAKAAAQAAAGAAAAAAPRAATAAPGVATAAQGVAPAATSSTSAASTGPSAVDQTALLASLADLRDRGAISAEEFDAKKAEILARI